ncbi:PtdIns(3,5)P(2) sythesis regulation factor [Orobanche minor]
MKSFVLSRLILLKDSIHLSSEHEATRIESLHWISTLLNRHLQEVLSFLNDIFDTLLKSLSDPSDQY